MSDDLYIDLFHGRDRPDAELDDWDFDGPVLGPFAWIHTTYQTHIKLGWSQDGQEPEWHEDVHYVDGLFYYDGNYYGDWSVRSMNDLDATRLEFPMKSKFIPPEEDAAASAPSEASRQQSSSMALAHFDNTVASAEGWSLFNDGELQRLDCGKIIDGEQSGEPEFDSDEDALNYVKSQAAHGSLYHRRALSLLKIQPT